MNDVLYAVRKGNYEKVKYLITKERTRWNNEPNISNRALSEACRKGNAKIAHYLLSDTDVDINWVDDKGTTPLLYAVFNNDIETVEILLQYEADVNLQDPHLGCTCLHYAIRSGFNTVFSILLAVDNINYRIPNIDGDTPLHEAAKSYYLKQIVAQELLDTDARYDINTPNNDGITPFHLACLHEKEILCRSMFLTGDVNFNLSDFQGNSPLHHACSGRSTKIVASLLKTRAPLDLHKRNVNGETPFLCACRSDSPVSIYLLNNTNVDVKTQDNSGNTPIKWAFNRINLKLIEALIKKGVQDINIKDPRDNFIIAFERLVDEYPQRLNIRSLHFTKNFLCFDEVLIPFISRTNTLESLKLYDRQSIFFEEDEIWKNLSKAICKNNSITELDETTFSRLSQEAKNHIKINQRKRFRIDLCNLWESQQFIEDYQII